MDEERERKFRDLSIGEKHDGYRKQGFTEQELNSLLTGGIRYSQNDTPGENTIGVISKPLRVAKHFRINGVKYEDIPMATEEPSVVAAASNGAKFAQRHGGFTAFAYDPVSSGQIQLMDVRDVEKAKYDLMRSEKLLKSRVHEKHPDLVKNRGGLESVGFKTFQTEMGNMLVVELFVNCGDANGANLIDGIAEDLAPYMESLTGGRAVIRMFSNYPPRRLVHVHATFDRHELAREGGFSQRETVKSILEAQCLSEHDVFEAVTRNKGIMNGIVAVGEATGQDTRGLESGAHSYAAIEARSELRIPYRPLARYKKDADGNLFGSIEVPIVVGVVGGTVKWNPVAKMNIEKFLHVSTSRDLACIMASVGLAQNIAALRAIACEGIQKGHMKLHKEMISEQRH